MRGGSVKSPKWGMRIEHVGFFLRQSLNARSMSMSSASHSFEINVSCGNCGTKTKKTLGWLRENNEFVAVAAGPSLMNVVAS